MNIDELIGELSKIRAERGNLTVLVNDGGWAPDYEPVKLIKTSVEKFWDEDAGKRAEREVVSLLTG